MTGTGQFLRGQNVELQIHQHQLHFGCGSCLPVQVTAKLLLEFDQPTVNAW